MLGATGIAVAGGIAAASGGGAPATAQTTASPSCPVPFSEESPPRRVANANRSGGRVESTIFKGHGVYTVSECSGAKFLRSREVVPITTRDGKTVRLVGELRQAQPDGSINVYFSYYDPYSQQFADAINSPEGQKQLEAVPPTTDGSQP